MTEIPEHLLKRSRDRRGALGLGGDEAAPAAASAPATTTPAAPATAAAPAAPAGRAAAPAAAAAPKPKPDSPVVAAYKQRRRIPFWAMAALSFLPIWGFMYARSVTAQPVEATGPLATGEEVFSSCQSCHGDSGQGSPAGYQFSEGEVLKTFPHIEDQLRFVYFGTANYNAAGVDIYGNPERDGGAHPTGGLGAMPAWGADAGGELTDEEILGVVCHERYTLGGADETADYAEEFEKWCSEESELYLALEDGSATLATLHEVDEEIMVIGDAPVPGSPASPAE